MYSVINNSPKSLKSITTIHLLHSLRWNTTSKSGVAGIVVINFNDFGLLFMFHLNWNRWSSEYLFQLFLFLKNLKKNNAVCQMFVRELLLLLSQGIVADF